MSKLQCEYCGVGMNTKIYSAHVRSCRKNPKKRMCKYCGKAIENASYTRHIKAHIEKNRTILLKRPDKLSEPQIKTPKKKRRRKRKLKSLWAISGGLPSLGKNIRLGIVCMFLICISN
jgi:predicted ferric reductase